MPVHPFDPQHNYWGYMPLVWGAVHRPYALQPERAAEEMAELVAAAHDRGMHVWLDVVFNHTGEGNASLPGLDNSIYYMLDPETGQPRNYSGCGNTLNCNHPVVRNLILDALRYWVAEMRVDGFRFDLA